MYALKDNRSRSPECCLRGTTAVTNPRYPQCNCNEGPVRTDLMGRVFITTWSAILKRLPSHGTGLPLGVYRLRVSAVPIENIPTGGDST